MTAKQKYQAACRLWRTINRLWRKQDEMQYDTPEYKALDEVANRKYDEFEQLDKKMRENAKAFALPLFVNSLGNRSNLSRFGLCTQDIGGKEFIFIDGKFMPYGAADSADSVVLAKAS